MPTHESRSPTAMLAWEVCARSRTAMAWLIGVISAAWFINAAFSEAIRKGTSNHLATGFPLLISMIELHLAGAAALLVLAVAACTELNPETNASGFPQRLFVLPVSTFRLVAVPTVLGAAGVELLLLVSRSAWHNEWSTWSFLLLPVYVVVYQSVLWTMSSLRALRLLILGVLAFFFITGPTILLFRGIPERHVQEGFATLGVSAFLWSWAQVARQRSGGMSRRAWVTTLVSGGISRWQRRERVFMSPLSAQIWFEWRRSGQVLPALVGGLLVGLILPLSWFMRGDAQISLLLLVGTLTMPVLLALPIGKAFSKPDFWSSDLTVPPIVAVRPLNSHDIVAVKMRVAAKSTAVTWSLVVVFLIVWFPLWANVDVVNEVRSAFEAAVLTIVAAILLTWRSLISSIWIGLRGNKRIFVLTGLSYAIVPFIGLIGIAWTGGHKQAVLMWIVQNRDSVLSTLQWIAAIAVIAKLCSAALAWRRAEHVWHYFRFWIAGTTALIALAIVIPFDTYRLRTVMILLAPLVMPLARIGVAPSSFARNRHR